MEDDELVEVHVCDFYGFSVEQLVDCEATGGEILGRLIVCSQLGPRQGSHGRIFRIDGIIDDL